jgi:hypothetical protein
LRTLSLRTCCRHYPGVADGRRLRSFAQPYQPSPIGLSGRPAHRPFRRLQLFRHLHRSGCFPAGAVAGWDLHPLKSAAFSRRTPTADILVASVPGGLRLTIRSLGLGRGTARHIRTPEQSHPCGHLFTSPSSGYGQRPVSMIESACGAASAPRNCGPLRNDHRVDKQGLSTLGEHRPECGRKQLPQHGSAGTIAARSPRRNPPRPYERSIVILALPDQPWG